MDVIFEILVNIVLAYPGAFIRWLISRLWKSEKSLKEFSRDAMELNAIISLSIIAGVIIMIRSIE